MSISASDNTGTTAVRAGFGFDVGALESWMRDHVEDYAGPLRVEQFKGGQSNPTYKLVTPAKSYVLRRQPPGPILRGAHAVDREARVMESLSEVGFPVPRICGRCDDKDVLGTAFFVMEMIEGRIFWDASFPEVSRAERPLYFDAMNRTIAQLHSLDPEAIGLGDYGRPSNYFERQIARWSQQYLDDTEAGRDPNMDRLIEWLPQNIPAGDDPALIHGDFRCDNMIFHPSEPRVLAVLDWELSTLGHAGADFAYHAMMYRMPPRFVAGLADVDIAAMNIPSEADYLAAYCRRRGLDGMPGYDFYIAFNFFRLAAIFHGIKGRVLRGTAASAQAQGRVAMLGDLMALAAAQIR